MTINSYLEHCRLCPQNCGANRVQGETGICQAGILPKVALVSKHFYEEPPISGTNGSGTVFFSHCNLRCIFCQNHAISQAHYGMEVSVERLAEIFLEQQNRGIHNINLVSPTHYIPQIRDALLLAKKKGLVLPVVYNTNGYEKVESLCMLSGLIDIYLPDLKYADDTLANAYSQAPGYFPTAAAAILEMLRQTGAPVFDSHQMMQKGVIIRHMVLPGARKDSEKVLEWIAKYVKDQAYVSLMNQYTPMYQAKDKKPLNRRLTTFEYQKVLDCFFALGLKNGYMQKKGTATDAYTPIFDLAGVQNP